MKDRRDVLISLISISTNENIKGKRLIEFLALLPIIINLYFS